VTYSTVEKKILLTHSSEISKDSEFSISHRGKNSFKNSWMEFGASDSALMLTMYMPYKMFVLLSDLDDLQNL